ncbi:MAG: DUF2726 domain-containing protein [Syntrophomonadaceae bacterium]
MAQLIVLLLLLVAGKLLWDSYNQQKTVKKKKPATGKVIDISNAWIDKKDMPYRKREYLLSAKELGLYQALGDVLRESSYIVFPKVRLADLLILNPDAKNYQEHRAKIGEFSVDMTVLELPEMKPVLLVLSDSGTEGRKKQLADRFIKSAAEAAGLPCLGINTSKMPGHEEIQQMLLNSGIKIKNRGYVNE